MSSLPPLVPAEDDDIAPLLPSVTPKIALYCTFCPKYAFNLHGNNDHCG
jgi:hypothetical protein